LGRITGWGSRADADSQQATHAGPNAVLYDLSGGLAANIGSTAQTVSEGAGTFIPAGTTTFRASAEPASFLIFMLSPAADSEKAPLSGLATVEDLITNASIHLRSLLHVHHGHRCRSLE
jgi:hypothetical protein